MKKKIRFLATGDFHSDEKLISKIKKQGKLDDVDFVVLVGDISEKKDDFSKLLGVFAGKDIFMVPGNHEGKKNIDALQEHYGVHLVGNQPVLIGDELAFFGTNYVPIGPYGLTEEEIFENLAKNYDAIKDVKVKVHLSHLPPAETKIGNASPFYPFIGGSDAVRFFLDNFKPDLTLVGHIHETSGLEEIVNKTKVVNVGRTFKVFEFDPESGKIKVLREESGKNSNKKVRKNSKQK